MNVKVEQLNQTRRRMLLGFLIGFFAWQSTIILSFIPTNPIIKYLGILLTPVGVIGAIIWIYYEVKLIRFTFILRKNPEINRALNDERIVHNRLKSFVVGFWTVLVLQIPLFLLSVFTDISTQFIILINILFMVSSTILAYLLYEGKNE